MTTESMIAMKPPSNVRIIFSTMNCRTSVAEEAPNALRTPISEDRSIMRLVLMFTRLSVGNKRNNKANTVATKIKVVKPEFVFCHHQIIVL